eukprot:802951-Pelagomonas_calceolata.AAC.2
MSQPLSQVNPGASASQSTANYIPTHPCQADNIFSPPTCPHTPHILDTQTNNPKIKMLHTVAELTPPVINPLGLLCQGSEVWK